MIFQTSRRTEATTSPAGAQGRMRICWFSTDLMKEKEHAKSLDSITGGKRG